MDILILGNGFDLAHDLPTKYSDFLDYCIKEYKNKDINYDSQLDIVKNLWLRHFIFQQQHNNSKDKTWIDLEEEIYNVLKIIRELPLVTKSGKNTEFCPQILYLNKNDADFNFADIKNNLTNCSEYNKNHFKASYNILLEIKEPKDLIYYLYQQLRDFTALFEKYIITEVIEKKDIKKFILKKTKFTSSEYDKQIYVLNFNYTNTLEKIYYSDSESSYKVHTIYVHGKVDKEQQSNIVLGTKNFNRKYNTPFGAEKVMPTEFNVFKKYFQRHKYNTIDDYQYLLKKVKEAEEAVFHIIGHSLDSSDRELLKHILTKNPNSIINIYYHNPEAQERLMNKIDDIIGEDEVMTKVKFIEQDDKINGILIPQKQNDLIC